VPRRPHSVKPSASCCPLTDQPERRQASAAQTASIRDNFPKGIAQPALRALCAAGWTTLDQLAAIREEQLLELHGMGPNAVRKLRDALRARGLDFRPPAQPVKPRRD
jgi:hypothetical protein